MDVHRDTVMACARTPDGAGGRREEVSEFRTTTSQLLLLLSDWLVERGVTLVGMEATGVYWKPVVRHEAPFDRVRMKGPAKALSQTVVARTGRHGAVQPAGGGDHSLPLPGSNNPNAVGDDNRIGRVVQRYEAMESRMR
ncbi:MAG: hypothetical protein CYG61_00920 [Actinobacteria bacterium]|nr:MAG: hypothetical protein CYG61_00920 [Actinomycetota bacterium]